MNGLLNRGKALSWCLALCLYCFESVSQITWRKTMFQPIDYWNFLTKEYVFWTFWGFWGWISAKLALIWSKMHLQHDSLPFLPLESRFTAFWLGHAQKSKFWEKVTYVFRLFDFWNSFFPLPFFSFSFLFAAVIGLLLGLLAVKKLLRKSHRGGQFLPWSS